MATEHYATHESSDSVKRKGLHEGPRNHFLAFALSLLLTLLAFIAIIFQNVLETWFLLSFIILLAILQAVIQAVFWMHLKDRGHLQQRIFFTGGAFIALTAIIMAVYWVWW
ncbi:MAG: cytochrome C oxidase subunit IV family protein [Paenibacillaceae bacterium]